MDDLTSINIGRGAGVNTVFTQERLNTILGVLAGNTNTSGNNNTFIVYTAGYNNTDGVENVFLGLAGISNTSGSQNTFIGNLAGMMNTTGNLNTAVGFRALYSNTGTGEGGQGNQEVAVGAWALENSISRGNVAVGPAALRNLEIGGDNVAVGGAALHNVVSGGSNTAIGSAAMLYTGATANNNVAIGRSAGERSRGDHNSFVGANSGFNVREGFANILIGSVSQASDSVAINQIVIGANADGVADNTVVLGNESVTDVYMGEDSGATVHAGMIALNMINESPSPTPGTIRWNGSDFVGWNGINWISLTGGAKVGELIDQDNNTYKTIIIGGQEWMAENLRVSTYKEGTPIDQITNDAIWSGLTAAAWCYYDNNPSFNEPYGKLYNWFAISGDSLCPDGWHVPTDADWNVLIDYLDPGMINPTVIGTQSAVSGGKMKETSHWSDPNTGASNESGFSGVGTGFRDNSGNSLDMGNLGYWWTSTEDAGPHAFYRELVYFYSDVNRKSTFKQVGASVRCIRD